MPWKAIVGMDLWAIKHSSEMIYYVIIHTIRYNSSPKKPYIYIM